MTTCGGSCLCGSIDLAAASNCPASSALNDRYEQLISACTASDDVINARNVISKLNILSAAYSLTVIRGQWMRLSFSNTHVLDKS